MDTDRVADIWGVRTPHPGGSRWPARIDQFLVAGVTAAEVERWVRGACLLCSNGCGLEIAVTGGRMVGVRGRAGDRVNHGRLGPKGLYGWQGQQHDRLTAPLVRDNGAAGRDRLGHRHGQGGRTVPVPAGGQGPAEPRLLHLGPADDRGVLHAGGDREGRDRHPAAPPCPASATGTTRVTSNSWPSCGTWTRW